MGQVGNQLSRASRNIGDRMDSLGNSRVQGARLLLDLDRQQKRDDRQDVLNRRQDKLWELGAPERQKAAMQMETSPYSISDDLPEMSFSQNAWIHGMDKGKKESVAVRAGKYGIKGMPGLKLDPKTLQILDSTGKPAPLPKWQRDEIREKVGLYFTSKADWVNEAEGNLLDMQMQLESMPDGPEKVAFAQQIKEAEEAFKGIDKAQVYNHQADLLRRIKANMPEGYNSKPFDDAISRYDRKLGALQKASAEKSKRDFEMEKLRIQEEGKDRRAKKTEPKLPLWNRKRIEQIAKDISDIDKAMSDGPVSEDGLPMSPEEAARWQTGLMARRVGLTQEAQRLQNGEAQGSGQGGGEGGGGPAMTPGQIAGQAIAELNATGKQYDPQAVAKTIEAKSGPEAARAFLDVHSKSQGAGKAPAKNTPKTPESPKSEFTDVIVDKDGTIWGKKGGQAMRIAVKPSEKIYNGRYDNPKYQEYLNLLKQYGLL